MFRKALVPLVVLVAAIALIAQAHQDQQTKKPLSPRGQASFSFQDGKKIVVDYGRPSMRGRKIMGQLVPYNQVWRTGANEATTFTTDVPLVIGGKQIPAGKYAIFTIPGENEWTVIFNKQTGQWGTKYDQAQDLARITVTPTKLQQPVEQFTISFDQRGPNAGVMKLEWENTSVSVDFTQSNTAQS